MAQSLDKMSKTVLNNHKPTTSTFSKFDLK